MATITKVRKPKAVKVEKVIPIMEPEVSAVELVSIDEDIKTIINNRSVVAGLKKETDRAEAHIREVGMDQYVKMVGDIGHNPSFSLNTGIGAEIGVIVSDSFTCRATESLYHEFGEEIAIKETQYSINMELIEANKDLISHILKQDIMVPTDYYSIKAGFINEVSDFCNKHDLDLTDFMEKLGPVLRLKA